VPTIHVAVEIACPAETVYAFVREPSNLPLWAAGLSTGIAEVNGAWVSDSPMGRVTVAFVPDNPFLVLDHDVTLPDGTVVTNPLRALGNGDRCELIFTIRGDGAAADADLVRGDLVRLRTLLEAC
jgi:hypothetical protein